MRILVRFLGTISLLLSALYGCNLLTHYHLVSNEYGFSVDFPAKPALESSTNYQGLPKSLWTLENGAAKEFYSAEATTYREPLRPAPNWVPDRELLASMQIQITDAKHFTMRAASGREVPAIATTARQLLTGSRISSIYIIDGATLISITARTDNAARREAFLNSLTMLR